MTCASAKYAQVLSARKRWMDSRLAMAATSGLDVHKPITFRGDTPEPELVTGKNSRSRDRQILSVPKLHREATGRRV